MSEHLDLEPSEYQSPSVTWTRVGSFLLVRHVFACGVVWFLVFEWVDADDADAEGAAGSTRFRCVAPFAADEELETDGRGLVDQVCERAEQRRRDANPAATQPAMVRPPHRHAACSTLTLHPGGSVSVDMESERVELEVVACRSGAPADADDLTSPALRTAVKRPAAAHVDDRVGPGVAAQEGLDALVGRLHARLCAEAGLSDAALQWPEFANLVAPNWDVPSQTEMIEVAVLELLDLSVIGPWMELPLEDRARAAVTAWASECLKELAWSGDVISDATEDAVAAKLLEVGQVNRWVAVERTRTKIATAYNKPRCLVDHDDAATLLRKLGSATTADELRDGLAGLESSWLFPASAFSVADLVGRCLSVRRKAALEVEWQQQQEQQEQDQGWSLGL